MEGADLKAIFDFIDKDKDGFISKDQFLNEVAKAAPDFVRQIQSFDDIQEPISFRDFEQLISQLEVNPESQDLDELESFQLQYKDKENWASAYKDNVSKRRSMDVESMISMESETSFDTFEQKRYADLANAYEKLVEDFKLAQEELQSTKSLSQKLVSLKQEKSQLEIDLENSRIEIEQLKEKEVLQGKRIVSLEKQIKQLDETLAQKTQQHQIEIGNLEADTKKLQFSATEKDTLQSQIKQLQSTKRELEERMQLLEQRNQQLIKQVKDRDAKILEEQQLNELRLERLQQELLQYRDSQLLSSAPAEQSNNSILEEHTKQLESHIHQLQADKEQLQHKIEQLQTEIRHQIETNAKPGQSETPSQTAVQSPQTTPRLPAQPEDNKTSALLNEMRIESIGEIHDEISSVNNGLLQAVQAPPPSKQDLSLMNAQNNEQVLAQVKELFELIQHQITLEKQISDLQSQLTTLHASDNKQQQATIYKLHLLLTELLQRISRERERSGSISMYSKNGNLQAQVATLLQSLKQYNNTQSATSKHIPFSKSSELPRALYWAVIILVPCLTSFFLVNLYSHV
mmetsp:Transcript_15228/g.21257  ORF Transcript_15228/g.21257 Transcript_15228/m.21257 type:complete len:573 (+) Transcript_15228:61-1779(+)